MNYYKSTRISNGDTANRILKALYDKLPIKTLISVRNTKIFYSNEGQYLDWYNLCYECIDDYAQLADASLSWLILGQENAFPDYTKYDEKVIPMIRGLSIADCKWMEDMIMRYHPVLLTWINNLNGNPTDRFNAYLSSRRPPFVRREQASFFLRPGYDTEEVCQEILRIRRMSSDGRYTTDFLPKLAQASGVSVHWIIGLTGALYCNTPDQEEIYDLFTLLPDSKKQMVVKMLSRITAKKEEIHSDTDSR